jgi:hypothetical protein
MLLSLKGTFYCISKKCLGNHGCGSALVLVSVADLYHPDTDPDLDPACHFDADPDPDPSFHFDADLDSN